MSLPELSKTSPTTQAVEIAIRLGLIFLILMWCLKILTPFISLVAWGAIIAVAIYSPYLKLVDKLGGRKKLTVTLIALVTIAVILIPVASLSTSMIESATKLGSEISTGQVHIAPPSESVKDWPLIGKRTYGAWHQASVDLKAFLEKYPNELQTIGKKLVSVAAGLGSGILQFIISTLIAGAFLLSAESARKSMTHLATRLVGDQGEELLDLSVSTIRSVAVGVIGIAFIQALLGGIGMMFAGVPAAGLFAIAILVLAIAQLPPLLVLGPVAFYVFSVASPTVAVVFLIWSVLVSFADMVLKPLLLGRGVEVPMLVILLGAIGGMITSGIVGLFIGAVILALGYSLFGVWVNAGNPPTEDPADTDKPDAISS